MAFQKQEKKWWIEFTDEVVMVVTVFGEKSILKYHRQFVDDRTKYEIQYRINEAYDNLRAFRNTTNL